MQNLEQQERWHFPHVGQRITKTTIAVFLCLMVYSLRGYSGQNMPTEAAITAIICMQPYVRDTREFALNRIAGTLVGTVWGLAFLFLLLLVPALGARPVILYALMGCGVLASLYNAVLIRKPDAASLAAIVFLCIVIAFPDIENPIWQTLLRILDVFIGTGIAIAVNVFRLPREKKRDRVFFVRTKDLVPDRFSQLPAAALFRLNYLYDDGAKICLMSEHAPAFLALQMGAARHSVPLIVMDGAAIYDADENSYLQAETIPQEDSLPLREKMDALGLSYFTYTIHKNKTCIFHQGPITELEKPVYDRMRRSPYRSYLEGEIYDPDEIVYFKLIESDDKVLDMERRLRKALPKARLRAVIRPQAGSPGVSALYIYAHTASMEQAEKRLMQMLREQDPTLTPVDIRLRDPYRSEHDAMHLLNTLWNSYEPVRLFPRRKKN